MPCACVCDAQANFAADPIYGTLEQTARNANLGRFRARKCRVLVVTDVAARGIDVPLLDNVINYDFPDKAKLFVHRWVPGAPRRFFSAHTLLTSVVCAFVCLFASLFARALDTQKHVFSLDPPPHTRTHYW